MHLRDLPSDKHAPAQQLGVSYDHLVFNRTLLLWLHVVLALAAVLSYLSTFDTSHIPWLRGRGWSGAHFILLRCTGVLIPYVISGVFSRRRVSATRSGLWLFTIILLAGTGAIVYFYVGRYDVTALGTLTAVLLQTTAYISAAAAFLPRKE